MTLYRRSVRVFLTVIVASMMIVLSTACGGKADASAQKTGPAPVQADIMIIKTEPFSYGIDANGSVLANEFVELKPEINGRLVQLNINEGNQVGEGALLAKIYDDDLQAQLKKYQTQWEIADKTVQRYKKLLDVNGLNQQEYDQAVSVADGLRADIDFTKAQIRKTEIRAPFSGMIGLRNVSPGAYVTQAQVLATLQQVNSLKVDFVLPEDQMQSVKNGMEVNIKSAQGNNYKAKVVAIEPQLNAGTRNVKVRAVIQDKASDINPGSFVVVNISESDEKGSILIPTSSIVPESRSKRVALIKNGVVQMQEIETGYRTAEKAVVLSGLNPGDTIAVSGILFLKPGSAIAIRSVK